MYRKILSHDEKSNILPVYLLVGATGGPRVGFKVACYTHPYTSHIVDSGHERGSEYDKRVERSVSSRKGGLLLR